MAFCNETYTILPLFGETEKEWPNEFRCFLYIVGLFWCFLGVAVISDVFMGAIERITSQKKRVFIKETGRTVTQSVWNDTVANLTLMALGSSAPEILLSMYEIGSNEMYIGDLGSGTIIGSAAFNLLIISAVCVMSIPAGEVRYIQDMSVYCCTASFSIFAYVWLLFVLVVFSPDVVEIWEGILTFLFFPVLIILAFLIDKGYFSSEEEDVEAPSHDNFYGAIPSDVTKEELAEIEQSIREEYNNSLTDEQLIKIMQLRYLGKPSRAYYRHAAIENIVGGKKTGLLAQEVPAGQVSHASNTHDEVVKEKVIEVSHATERYAFLESCQRAKFTLCRTGILDKAVSVQVTTREGTAKSGSDFEAINERVVFARGEKEKTLEVNIIDDVAYEEDEEFYVDISDPKIEDDSSEEIKVRIKEGLEKTTIVIVDDDQPGIIRFQKEQIEVDEQQKDPIRIMVERYNGATGPIGCDFYTEDSSAIAGYDYIEVKGKLAFETSMQTACIEITIKPKGRYERTSSFNVYLAEATGGARFDKNTDGGADCCICNVVIKANKEQQAALDRMASQINWNQHALGYSNWKDQFIDAIFLSPGEPEEEGDEPVPLTPLDWALHIVGIPWKLLFACVPPVDYCQGWACFCCSLIMIGLLTAVVGDMANLVGCTLGINPEITAITFVALGTSLPDTFASQTAAVLDPYADASIGNVTGSNSVNVFLGLGMPWTFAAIYWACVGNDPSDQTVQGWISYMLQKETLVQQNVEAIYNTNGGYPCFVVPAGSLWFNLLVFSLNAGVAIGVLYARRKAFGGELGGPRKWQIVSACFLCGQWLLYVGLSSWAATVKPFN